MEWLSPFLDYLLHLDVHLAELADQVGPWAYIAVGVVIFAETGLVVAPFLPGESLLLASGTLAGAGILDIRLLAPLLLAAAFLGDVCNFFIGRVVGRRVLAKPRRHLRPEHVERAHRFYERHGGLAIVLARFLPVVRSLAPFVAGVAEMEIHHFLAYAGVASALWVGLFLGAGYGFGTAAWVKDYLAFALVAVVAASALPGLVIGAVRFVQARRRAGGRRGTRRRRSGGVAGERRRGGRPGRSGGPGARRREPSPGGGGGARPAGSHRARGR